MKSPARPEREAGAGLTPGKNMERLIAALVEALPVFDRKAFESALAELREHPRASLHYLFARFGACSPAEQAMISRLLLARGGDEVIDNLNAIVFDVERDERAKVMANDLLEQLGQPVDPEVFTMSVPEPEPYRRGLPSSVRRLLAEGDVAGAIEAARSLHQAERAILMTDAIREHPEHAMPFIAALAESDESDAAAAIAAIGAERFEAGVPWLMQIQDTAPRSLQKAIKKALFDLRKEGVEIREPVAEEAAPASEEPLPLYRCLMSEPGKSGYVIVLVARTRPDGRLKVFSVVVSLWKRGIEQAALRLSVARSAFERFVREYPHRSIVLKDVALEECVKMVARGLRVARVHGAPLPYDFGAGKELLGDVEKVAEEIENPFLCSVCNQPLDEETVRSISASAAYDDIQVETRCAACRNGENPPPGP